MATYYYITMYGKEKVYYAKVDSLDEAIQICNLWDSAKVQERMKGRFGAAKVVYEKWNGTVTTC